MHHCHRLLLFPSYTPLPKVKKTVRKIFCYFLKMQEISESALAFRLESCKIT